MLQTAGSNRTYRYMSLANELENKISAGQYKVGEKLPSLRELHAQTGLSITTINQAYIELENRGLIMPREKSGFYVKPLLNDLLPLPSSHKRFGAPRKVSINSLVESIHASIHDKDILPFGAALPGTELLPLKQLNQSAKTVMGKYFKGDGLNYGPPDGAPELKRQIATRTIGYGHHIEEDDIIITNGCMDAIQLCLRAISSPGDVIITESPTFTCYLQLIEDMGLLALELPTSPSAGIDLVSLENSLKKHKVAGCILNHSFQNPLGFRMSEDSKMRLLEILTRHKVPVIEDDIYGDLYFGNSRPASLASCNEKATVLYCSSFSKSLAPDLRVGWMLPGKFKEKIKRLKFNSSIACPKLNQLIIADFLQNGHYERHLRKYRNAMKNQVSNTARAIARYFPEDTKLTAPDGGYVLWLELNKKIDSIELYSMAREENIFIIPGGICTSTGKYKNCIRISCGNPWNDRLEHGIRQLGKIIKKMVAR
ncbi:MAG: PLP-dependent aminotransferase family protein [Desulfobulbaceae bacterium]|nr:PLP-dependent aminotransferase family protein [Desulfobulbaceae bacterium]